MGTKMACRKDQEKQKKKNTADSGGGALRRLRAASHGIGECLRGPGVSTNSFVRALE